MAIYSVITKVNPNLDTMFPGKEFPNKKFSDEKSYQDLIYYVTRSDKASWVGGYAVNTNPSYAISEMANLTRAYGKSWGVRVRHSVLSFSKEERDILEEFGDIVGEVGYIADVIARYYGGNYQILYAVHSDRIDNIHIHFVMNTINYNTGYKFNGKKSEYYPFISYMAKFLKNEYNIQVKPVPCYSDKTDDIF